MFKSVLAIVVTSYAVVARRFQRHTKLDTHDDIEAQLALSNLMFAQPPLASIASRRPARSEVHMGGGVEALRNRLTSTKKAGKLTKTMKLVAAARAQRAAKEASTGKSFMEELRQQVTKLSDRLAFEDTSDIPLLEERPAKKVALVVITGDRGLCGGYNSKILKKTDDRIKELSALGIDAEIYSIGSKGNRYYGARSTPLASAIECGAEPTAEESQKIVKEIVDRFLEGEVDRAELIYTSFTSMASSTPCIRTMIPFSVSADGIEMEDDEIKRITSSGGDLAVETVEGKSNAASISSSTVLEQAPEELVNRMLPMYLNGGMLSAWQNCVAAELASRYIAMQAATDNAEALAEDLEKQMNRMRQAAITQELAEIVAGAAAN